MMLTLQFVLQIMLWKPKEHRWAEKRDIYIYRQRRIRGSPTQFGFTVNNPGRIQFDVK